MANSTITVPRRFSRNAAILRRGAARGAWRGPPVMAPSPAGAENRRLKDFKKRKFVPVRVAGDQKMLICRPSVSFHFYTFKLGLSIREVNKPTISASQLCDNTPARGRPGAGALARANGAVTAAKKRRVIAGPLCLLCCPLCRHDRVPCPYDGARLTVMPAKAGIFFYGGAYGEESRLRGNDGVSRGNDDRTAAGAFDQYDFSWNHLIPAKVMKLIAKMKLKRVRDNAFRFSW